MSADVEPAVVPLDDREIALALGGGLLGDRERGRLKPPVPGAGVRRIGGAALREARCSRDEDDAEPGGPVPGLPASVWS